MKTLSFISFFILILIAVGTYRITDFILSAQDKVTKIENKITAIQATIQTEIYETKTIIRGIQTVGEQMGKELYNKIDRIEIKLKQLDKIDNEMPYFWEELYNEWEELYNEIDRDGKEIIHIPESTVKWRGTLN